MFDFLKPKEPESLMIEKPARIGVLGLAMDEKDVAKIKAAAESQKTATQEQTARAQKFADIRANADKRTWEEPKQKDEFLEGFNYYSEKKEEPQKVSMVMQPIRSFGPLAAASNKYADSKVMEKPKDAFLEGFYYYDEGKKEKEDVKKKTSMIPKYDFLEGFNYYTNGGKEKADIVEFGEGSDAYKILQDLEKRWNSGDEAEKHRTFELAQKVRKLAREGTPPRYAQDSLVEALKKNAKIANEYQKSKKEGAAGLLHDAEGHDQFLSDAMYLITMVDHGPMDYKRTGEWRVPWDEYDGKILTDNEHNYRNWLPWLYFDGELIGADKVGNMNMSYVGKKMGLPEWVYENFETMDKDDPKWVKRGISLAEYGR